MESYHSPSEEQAAKLMQGNLDAPVAALNLFWFNERAQYQPEDPEFETAAADVSGREAYATYAAEAGSQIAAIGGHVAFSTTVDQVMIGPDYLSCDIAAVMVFPTRRALIQMMTAPEFQGSSRHRKAALANHVMLHLDGIPFTAAVE